MSAVDKNLGGRTRLAISGILVTAVVLLWSAGIGVAIYRMLGVSISTVNGQAASFADEVFIHGFGNVFFATGIHCLILVILFIRGITYRWSLVALLLFVLGTPVALLLWIIAKNAQHCYGRDRVILG